MATAKKNRRLGRGLSSLVSMESPVRVDVPPRRDGDEERADSPGLGTQAGASGSATAVLDIEDPDDAGGSVEGEPDNRAGTDRLAGDKTDGERIVRIPLGEIRPNPRQPRRDFDEQSLLELAESIKTAGMIQPIVVRPVPTDGEGDGDHGSVGYELIAGERRWRAAELLDLSDVPAIVREASDEQSAELALIENIQREDLNPMERAWALRELGEMLGLSHGEIGERIGQDRSSVANLIRLTELEEDIQSMVRAGALGMGHARALLAAPAGAARVELAHRAAGEEWTVRRVEREAKALKQGRVSVQLGGAIGTEPSAALSDLERQLSEHFGTKVTITTNRAGDTGRISISFFGLDHFDGLMGMLGFEVK